MVPMVAAVYLVTHSPRLVANLTECWIQMELSGCPQPPPHWLNLLVLVSHVCLTLNSSLNFFIYFGFSRKFQQYIASLRGKAGLEGEGFSDLVLLLNIISFDYIFPISLLITTTNI